MRCTSCTAENPEHAKFCLECGAQVVTRCATCGAELPGRAKFCLECGKPIGIRPASPSADPRSYTPKHLAEKILTSRGALEGERKQVTVLFADVKGSMDLAEEAGPEEWHQILDRFFAILTEGVHRFEGTVNQYTGDGIMALFGAPIAREDHAKRACYAALHLQEKLRRYSDDLRLTRGLNFSVKIGLNSGEVVVGKIGDDLRMDYTAQGHTVGLAARMEQIAQAGSIYLTDLTAKLVSGFFALRDLGKLVVKGTQAPVRVYELMGVGTFRTSLEVSRARGFSRFVGRDDETASLEAALGRAMAGNAQVVGVVADAGVGKSRLCYEFAEQCRSKGIAVYEAHAVAHGKAIPFLTLLEYLRGYFGIVQQDPPLAAREKIAGRVLLLDPELTEALPLLFDFLGVSDPEGPAPRVDPEARQRRLFAAMRRVMHAQSRREATVTLVEDLHWIDHGSEAFLESLVEALPGTRTLLVVNFRPEYHAEWMQRSYYQQLPLTPLASEAIDALLRALLGADASLDALPGLIRERTGGNPFFIEEVIQALVEDGSLVGVEGSHRLVKPIEKLAVPVTVQAVLAARIDRLGSREKHLLQTAAVIGREFGEPILKHVAELSDAELAESLAKLAAAEFIHESAPYPQTEYAFKHPLTREVAYGSQLLESRRRLHAAVGHALAEIEAGRLDERAALVAHHWEEAGELLEAARWHERAARWAGSRDPTSALRHWRRVKELPEKLPAAAEPNALRLSACIRMIDSGIRVGLTEQEAAVLFAESKKLAVENGDAHSLAMLLSSYSALHAGIADLDEALAMAEEAVRVAAETNHPRLKLVVLSRLAFLFLLSGRLADALSVAEQGLGQASRDPRIALESGFSASLFLEMLRGFTYGFLGRLEEGHRVLDRVADLARSHGDLENFGFARSWGVYPLILRGDMSVAMEYARQAVETAEKLGSPLSLATAYDSLGLAQLESEQWGEAAVTLTRVLAVSRQSRTFLYSEARLLAYLAEACLGRDDLDGARKFAEEAATLARTRRWPRVLLTRARVLRRCEGADALEAIEENLHEALSTIRESGQQAYEPYVHLELAELARLVGDAVTRQGQLREAHRLFSEMGATIRATEIAKELDR